MRTGSDPARRLPGTVSLRGRFRPLVPVGARSSRADPTHPGHQARTVASSARSAGAHLHVDTERCEGHGRCYALAPELFEPDDIGNGHEIGDGTVPAGMEAKAELAVGQLPGAGDHIVEGVLMGLHEPVVGLGDRLRPHRRGVGRRPVPDLGRAAPDLPRRPHRPLRRRVAADPPRGRLRHRLRHRALHVAQHRRDRRSAHPSRWPRRASPRPSRPTRRSTTAPAGCCCRRSRRRRSTSWSRRRGPTARSWSTPCRATTSSTRPRTTPSTSRCGSSPTCSASRRRTPTCSAPS